MQLRLGLQLVSRLCVRETSHDCFSHVIFFSEVESLLLLNRARCPLILGGVLWVEDVGYAAGA